MPFFGLGHGLPFLDVPRVPDPHTGLAGGEAPSSQDLLSPVRPAVTADSLGWQQTGEILPGLLQLGVVTEVSQQSLVTSLATVKADLVTEHHLKIKYIERGRKN